MRTYTPRVLVVEDEDPIRSALDVALRGESYQVRAEPNGTDILAVAAQFRPDMAVLDVRLLEGPDGYTMARMLRESSNLPILFLTAADSIEDRLAGFRAGGDDYVIKPFSMSEFLARVEALLRRAGRLGNGVREVGDVTIDEVTRSVARAGHEIEVTRTEYELLRALADRPGQVLSKLQLLAQVWGFDAYDTNLVEVHVSSLRKKLEAHGPRILLTARGVGYSLKP